MIIQCNVLILISVPAHDSSCHKGDDEVTRDSDFAVTIMAMPKSIRIQIFLQEGLHFGRAGHLGWGWRSRDRLIFNMGIPIPGKDCLYIATGACFHHDDMKHFLPFSPFLWGIQRLPVHSQRVYAPHMVQVARNYDDSFVVRLNKLLNNLTIDILSCISKTYQRPILQIWFNFNLSMDKQLHSS